MVLPFLLALFAVAHAFRITLFLEVLKARVIIGKLAVKVVDGVP